MPVTTIFISGPPQSGKTALAHTLAAQALNGNPPHLVRLWRNDNCVGASVSAVPAPRDPALRGSWVVPYAEDLAMEILPEAIHEIRNHQKYVTMLLEADVDPALRYAFTYTHRIFTIPAPERVRDLFRSAAQAARTLHEVLEDTAMFTREILGAFGSEFLDDDEGVKASMQQPSGQPPQHRVDVDAGQMRHFLATPLGAEVATRVQLQPPYHSLADSDVVVINTAKGRNAAVVDECARKLRTLLNRIREGVGRHYDLFVCDPACLEDPGTVRLIERMRELAGTDGAS